MGDAADSSCVKKAFSSNQSSFLAGAGLVGGTGLARFCGDGDATVETFDVERVTPLGFGGGYEASIIIKNSLKTCGAALC